LSNLEAIQLILSLLLAGVFVTTYVVTHLHRRSDALTTGMLGGVAISPKERRMILVQEWLPLACAISGLDLILALSFMQIAANVVEESITLLAWLSAGLSGFGAVFMTVQGSVFFTSWLSILRDADAD
jgi:hypothetical protein